MELPMQALLRIKGILDSLGVPFCLAHGTLLGIYRDGDLLPGDSDIDVMLPWSVDRVWLANELTRMGCTITSSQQDVRGVSGQWCLSVLLPPHDLAVEISFLLPENGKVWFGFARGQNVIRIPLSPFTFTTICYLGVDFPIPNPCDRHLSEIYGENWHIRTRNRNFFIIHQQLDDPHHIRITYTFNHILGGLIKGNYKKAQGYTEQLLSVYDDPLLLQLREYFASVPNITLFEPLPWQKERIYYRDVIGG